MTAPETGRVDRYYQFAHLFAMKRIRTIFNTVKAFVCLALLLAVVLFPPKAVHASSSEHGGHGAVMKNAANQEHANVHSGHADHSTGHAEYNSEVGSADQNHGSTQCCSDVCLSVALVENHEIFVVQATSDHYLTLNSQIASFDPNSFLRPPRS